MQSGALTAAVPVGQSAGCKGAPSHALAFVRGQVRPIDIMDDYDERTPIDHPPPSQRGVHIRATTWIWSRKHEPRLLRFYVANPTHSPYRVARAYLQDEGGTPDLDAEIWLDHQLVTSGPIEVPPGERFEGFIWVLNPDRLGDTATLAISEPNGNPRVHDDIPAKVEFIEFNPPLTPKQKEQQRREREAKRVSLHVMGSYGAIWLPSGVSGSDAQEVTGLTGFGIRVTKGILPMWAVEADISGAPPAAPRALGARASTA